MKEILLLGSATAMANMYSHLERSTLEIFTMGKCMEKDILNSQMEASILAIFRITSITEEGLRKC